MFCVYILQSKKDNKLYTGCTNNLQRRFNEHERGEVFSTKNRRPFKLIYYEACLNSEDAKEREEYLKTAWGKRYLKNRLKNCLKPREIELASSLSHGERSIKKITKKTTSN